MLNFVSASWVQDRLDSPEILLLDPRSPLRYTAGHPKGAVNAPVAKARDAHGRLLPIPELAHWLGGVGVDYTRKPVVYDSADGRNAAMLAWILLYLGFREVHLMESLWEAWVAAGREVFYRPVAPVTREFKPRSRPELRATLDQVASCGGACVIDFRSRDEYTGKVDNGVRPGHIPGAVHIAWQNLAGRNGNMLAPEAHLRETLASAKLKEGQQTIAYCQLGARAALGFIALTKLGHPAALYDGSYSEWAKSEKPVEASEAKEKSEKA
jgi:thiosulfate/3-mercaptopyruvate sulfurtransferase